MPLKVTSYTFWLIRHWFVKWIFQDFASTYTNTQLTYQTYYWVWWQVEWQTVTDGNGCSGKPPRGIFADQVYVRGYMGGLLFPELSLDACDWNTHTWIHTLSLIAVCCPSSRQALWKGHLTKPLTGRCNTCVCSELSDTKRHLWALPWQEKHCDIWLSDWPTGLQAGWQIKAGRHTNTIEAVMETSHVREQRRIHTFYKAVW